jgi:hypothetical protein
MAHRLKKKEGSIYKRKVPPLWPTYVGEMRTTFAKAYGINVRCYWELFEEHVRNLGTLSFDPCLTPRKNIHGKCPLFTVQVESEQWTVHSPHQNTTLKKVPLFPPLTHKTKREYPSLRDTTSHWLHENSVSKIGCHSFWPVLIALPKNTLSIHLSSPIH